MRTLSWSIILLLSCIDRHTFVGAVTSGSCFDNYGIAISSCSELATRCSSYSCSDTDGYLAFTCLSLNCNGATTPDTPAPTTPAPTSPAPTTGNPSTTQPTLATSGSCVADYNLALSSCDAAQEAFADIGCTCYHCVETQGQLELSCLEPFQCSGTGTNPDVPNTIYAPTLTPKDYWVVVSVYVGITAVVTFAAKWYEFWCQRRNSEATDDSIAKNVTSTIKFIWKGKFMTAMGNLAFQHCVAPVLDDNRQRRQFWSYFVDEHDLFNIVSCHRSSSTAASQPARWLRVGSIIRALLLLTSLAFLFGTIEYDSENCVSTRTVADCKTCECDTLCNGVSLGCTAACECLTLSSCSMYSCNNAQATQSSNTYSSTTSTECWQSDEVVTSDLAGWISTALTQVLEAAFDVCISTASVGSRSSYYRYFITYIITAGLFVFSWWYSSSVTRDTGTYGDSVGASKRSAMITTIMFNGWWKDQLTDLVKVPAFYILYVISYYAWIIWIGSTPKNKQSTGGAIIYPGERPLRLTELKDLSGEKPMAVKPKQNG